MGNVASAEDVQKVCSCAKPRPFYHLHENTGRIMKITCENCFGELCPDCGNHGVTIDADGHHWPGCARCGR